jgi:hypothetical protein
MPPRRVRFAMLASIEVDAALWTGDCGAFFFDLFLGILETFEV